MRLLKQSYQSLLAPLRAWWGATRSCEEVLHIGRHSVQRGSVGQIDGAKHQPHTDLSAQGKIELPELAWDRTAHSTAWPVEALTDALAQLFPRPPQGGGVEVVLESTWLPVMLAETGGVLVSEAEAEALLRHRLAQLYDTPHDPVVKWDVRVSFSPGDALALGYGLSPQVGGALNNSAARLGFKITALFPAWSWGWQRAQTEGVFAQHDAKIGVHTARWWGWQEQDRLLLGRVEGEAANAQLKSLHPGLLVSDEPQYWAQTVHAEARRLNLSQVPQDLRIGTWTTQGCRFTQHPFNTSI